MDPEWYGYFYGGDCYLILYSYLVNSRNCYLLYMWLVSMWTKKVQLSLLFIIVGMNMKHLYFLSLQGRHATKDEVTAMAFQSVDLDQEYGGEPVQVRVIMGKEPRHFMAIFKGKMVIFEVGLMVTLLIDWSVVSLMLLQKHRLFPFLLPLGRHIQKRVF